MIKFLTNEEIAEVTGRKRATDQIKWLMKNRYLFEVDVNGKPKVLHDYLIRRMVGVPLKAREP